MGGGGAAGAQCEHRQMGLVETVERKKSAMHLHLHRVSSGATALASIGVHTNLCTRLLSTQLPRNTAFYIF